MLSDKLHPTPRPPHRLIRRKEMLRRVGVGYDVVLTWIKNGVFPAPVRLGPRLIAWIESEVDDFIANLPRGISDFRPNPRSGNSRDDNYASAGSEVPSSAEKINDSLERPEGARRRIVSRQPR